MKNMKHYILGLLGAFISIIAGAILFFSYNAYRSSIVVERNYQQSLGRLEQEIAELKAQLAAIQVRAENDSTHIIPKTGNAVTLKTTGGPMVSQRDAVRRLEKIVESTGLERLAANDNMDPAVFSEMYAEYERARLRRLGDADRQASDQAFTELLAKYPDAYATGMSIAERAMFSGFRRNTSEVERYYDMLRQNENFLNVVTDRGVEAMPNIEYYLARQYLRQGSIDSAQALIESLEKNYPDSRLFTGRLGGGRRWQPASQVIPGLRQELELTR